MRSYFLEGIWEARWGAEEGGRDLPVAWPPSTSLSRAMGCLFLSPFKKGGKAKAAHSGAKQLQKSCIAQLRAGPVPSEQKSWAPLRAAALHHSEQCLVPPFSGDRHFFSAVQCNSHGTASCHCGLPPPSSPFLKEEREEAAHNPADAGSKCGDITSPQFWDRGRPMGFAPGRVSPLDRDWSKPHTLYFSHFPIHPKNFPVSSWGKLVIPTSNLHAHIRRQLPTSTFCRRALQTSCSFSGVISMGTSKGEPKTSPASSLNWIRSRSTSAFIL